MIPPRQAIAILIILISCTAPTPAPETNAADDRPDIDTYAFMEKFRVAHYLEEAVRFQKLPADERVAGLRKLAVDPKRASEVFPICRMLFEPKAGGEFRRPMLGGPAFVDRTDDIANWPLEPIVIRDNIPILIVTGYDLAGQAESPDSYVEYCLTECRWRETKWAVVDQRKVKKVIEDFIAVHPKVVDESEFLRQQAD